MRPKPIPSVLRFFLSALAPALVAALAIACASPAGPNGPAVESPSTESAQQAPISPSQPRDDSTPETMTSVLYLHPPLIGPLDPTRGFRLGVELLPDDEFRPLLNKRVGLVANNTAVSQRGRHTAELLASAPRVNFARAFLILEEGQQPSPAFLRGIQAEDRLTSVILTPSDFRPDFGDLEDLDVLLIDMALTGRRDSLDVAALGAVLEQAALHGRQVVILDRPNLAANNRVSGPIGSPALAGSLSSFLPIALIPGMTTGELARHFRSAYGLEADLVVMELQEWQRSDGPSPWLQGMPRNNLGEPARAALDAIDSMPERVPGGFELELAHDLVSDGPWNRLLFEMRDGVPTIEIEPRELPVATILERLDVLAIPGLVATPGPPAADGNATTFLLTPDNNGPDPVLVALALWRSAVPQPASIPVPPNGGAFADPSIYEALREGIAPAEILRLIEASPLVQTFREQRATSLLYD